MQRSQSEVSHRFSLPNGQATNSYELRHLQKKFLQNHIQSNSKSILYRQPSEPLPYSSNQQYDYSNRQGLKQQQFTLNQDLLNQIKMKHQLSRMDKESVLSQEHQQIRNNQGMDALEKEKQRQFNQKYALEAQQDLQIKRRKKESQKNEEIQEKEYYRNRYNRYSMGNLTQAYNSRSNSYENPIRNYAYQLSQKNPQHIPNSSFKITHRADCLSALDFMCNSSQNYSTYKFPNSYFNDVKQQQCMEKDNLKESLLQQIREKQERKKNEKQRNKDPYTSGDYAFKHHPIYNPVDYRFAHDNRYMMSELGRYK